jgi:probable F420-dependent oxidoreductase
MRFGVSLPTCKEGLNLPLPFCDLDELIELFVLAEALGFDSAWGNDHITAPFYVRADYEDAPRFYEPLMTFAAVSRLTSRIRLGTAVLVLPMRDPVLVAKQISMLDQLSHGRAILGVGTGAYREEFELAHPRSRGGRRGDMLDEGLETLRLLFSERSPSHSATYYEFTDLELYPKPVQDPLPIFVGGNSAQVLRRAAMHAQGWLPGALPLPKLVEGRSELRRLAEERGRDPGEIEIAPQYMCCLGASREQALGKFKRSRLYAHFQSLDRSTLRGHGLEEVVEANLIGSAADVVEQIARLEEAGVTMLAAMSFESDSAAAMASDMAWFAEEVMPHFDREGGQGDVRAPS